MPCHINMNQTMVKHLTPCHVMPCHQEPRHTVRSRATHPIPYSAMQCHSMPHSAVPCRTVPCRVIPFRAVRCSAAGRGLGQVLLPPLLPPLKPRPVRAPAQQSRQRRRAQDLPPAQTEKKGKLAEVRSETSWGGSEGPPRPPAAPRPPLSPSRVSPFPRPALSAPFIYGSRRGMGEASDTDSGIMLHSGPDSPVSPPKERVQAGRRQQQALEARLDGCVQELRRLCLREAELTGTLPREYPLKAGEKPPKVRRRIGAAFKLDEIVVLRGVDPLERERALQLQIAEASRRLCHEENIDRRVRKRRQTAALREEQKLRDLEQVLIQRRLLAGQRDTSTAEELSASDESSMSDAGLLEEGEGAVGSRGDTRVPLVCSLHSNPSCVPSIPTLPVSSPSQPTQVPSIPLHCHVFPLCHSCVSLPTPHMSPLCHSPVCPFHPNPPHVPSMPTIHLFPPSQPSLCVPSIPTLHLSYRGHTATRTCHPTEVPISKGPRRGGGGVRASDGPPPLPGRRPAWTDPMRGPKMPVWTLRMGKPRAPSAILGP
uniref:Innate immunity activator n=1 Tax=Corvus moneduloides TaxID=1196302 RepID=A0A8U7NBJ5_CORMO